MMGVKQTPTYRLIEAKLGEPLGPFVERHLADERPMAWIARKLRRETGVDFSDEWLRKYVVNRTVTAA